MTLWRLGVVAASKSAGAATAIYLTGGYPNPASTTTQKITTATDTISTLGASAPTGVGANHINANNRATAGYVLGGGNSSGFTSTAQKFTISSQTWATLPTGLPTVSQGNRARVFSTTAAYGLGASTPIGPTPDAGASFIRKILFSTDAISQLPATLTATSQNDAWTCTNAPDGIGYTAGGIGLGTVINKFTFSTESRSTSPTSMPDNGWGNGNFFSTTAGYKIGGTTNGSRVDKFVFSTEAVSQLGTGTSAGRRQAGGGESSTHGYIIAGVSASGPPAYSSTVDKFAFSDDSRSSAGVNVHRGMTTLATFNGQ